MSQTSLEFFSLITAASVLGALLRWALTAALRKQENRSSSTAQPPTFQLSSTLADPVLIANLLSLLVAGATIAFFGSMGWLLGDAAGVVTAETDAVLGATISDWQVIVLLGFCGGLSTFSSLALSLAESLLSQNHRATLLDTVLNLLGGVVALFCGMGIGMITATAVLAVS